MYRSRMILTFRVTRVKPHAGVNDGVIDDMNDIEPTYEIVNGTFPVTQIYILIKQIIW